MEIAILGLGHVFKKEYDALKRIDDFTNIELCDNDLVKVNEYKCNNDYLKIKSDTVVVETSPSLHLEMINNLIKLNKKVIVEKPVVTSLEDLLKLKKIINKDNYYNSLHFSFGLEIDYFIKNINKIPNKIRCFISDNYVENSKIKKEQLGLCGCYLDEVINPLSALGRMFGYDIKFINCDRKKYMNDLYDYYSLSKFNMDGIDSTIEVLWNDQTSQKYIDLYYDDKIIRLDSMNQSVIDLTNNLVLFKGDGDRMTNHYIGVYNNYLKVLSNMDISLKLHEELLKGVNND